MIRKVGFLVLFSTKDVLICLCFRLLFCVPPFCVAKLLVTGEAAVAVILRAEVVEGTLAVVAAEVILPEVPQALLTEALAQPQVLLVVVSKLLSDLATLLNTSMLTCLKTT